MRGGAGHLCSEMTTSGHNALFVRVTKKSTRDHAKKGLSTSKNRSSLEHGPYDWSLCYASPLILITLYVICTCVWGRGGEGVNRTGATWEMKQSGEI